MVRVTLAQMRRSIPRLVAAGLAIAIGTAFVAATLLAGDVMSRTGRDAVTAQLAQADVVVDGSSEVADSGGGFVVTTVVTDETIAAVRALPGVAAADVLTPQGVQLRTGRQDRYQVMLPTVSDPRLTSLTLAEGREPGAGEIALPVKAAEDLGVAVGDTVTAVWQEPPADGGDGAWVDRTQDVTLVGLLDDPHHAWTTFGGAGTATLGDLLGWARTDSVADLGGVQLLVAGAPGTSAETLLDEVRSVLPEGAAAMTRDEAAAEALNQLGESGSSALVAVVLGFAAIALIVAGLVISNTFQVLVAQRTRTLALLRAVGARRAQLRGSVLLEAGILGLASSAVGALAGIALAQGMLTVLGRTNVDVALPSTVAVTWPVVVVPLVVGTAVTTLASLVPARAATRVTAIEALRPLDAPTVHGSAGATRAGFAVALSLLGLVGLGGAAFWGTHDGNAQMLPLALGILTGAVSFVGILLGAVFWVPPLARLAQRLLSPLGPVPRLATANTVRNPRRTAATSTALIIGVTLVALMSTGAASARASLAATLDQHFPVDVAVTPVFSPSSTDAGDALPDGLATDVGALDGVAHVATLRSALVTFPGDSELWARAIAPDDAVTVMRDQAMASQLADDTVLVPDYWPAADGDTATLRPAAGGGTAPAGDGVTLHVVPVAGLDAALLTPATLAELAPDAVADTLFVALTPSGDPVQVLREVQDALGSAAFSAQAPGAARAQYDRVIDVMLAVVVGLLGVAVVIALLGVANTLSLSVIERRRESATLRAMGLTRGRLRGTLAIEGMVIAGVGAVGGGVLGVMYGWAGAATVLGQAGGVSLAVPWRDLGLVLAVALAAGLLASVVPARSAVRTSPVAALAEE